MEKLQAMLKDAFLLKASDLVLQSSLEPIITWQGRTETLEDHGVSEGPWLLELTRTLLGPLFPSLGPDSPQKGSLVLENGKTIVFICFHKTSLTVHIFLPPDGSQKAEAYWQNMQPSPAPKLELAQDAIIGPDLALDVGPELALDSEPLAPTPPAAPAATPTAPAASIPQKSENLSKEPGALPADLFGSPSPPSASEPLTEAQEPPPAVSVEVVSDLAPVVTPSFTDTSSEATGISFKVEPELPFKMDPAAAMLMTEQAPVHIPEAPSIPTLAQEMMNNQREAVQRTRPMGENTNAIKDLLDEMQKTKASTLHLSPGYAVAYRNAGVLSFKGSEKLSEERIIQLIEPLIPTEQKNRLGQKRDIDFYSQHDRKFFRVHISQDIHGLTALLHSLASEIPSLSQLGAEAQVTKLCMLKEGLVCVAAASQEKKSAILAAILAHINRTRPARIVSIEKPITFFQQPQLGIILQREPGIHTPSFASGLASALREDPDVILVSELNDAKSAKLVLEAAARCLVFIGLTAQSAEEAQASVYKLLPELPGCQRLIALVFRDIILM